ncbi:hypothetical protein Ancab_009185 [Ancistrocladus abbreviatus]
MNPWTKGRTHRPFSINQCVHANWASLSHHGGPTGPASFLSLRETSATIHSPPSPAHRSGSKPLIESRITLETLNLKNCDLRNKLPPFDHTNPFSIYQEGHVELFLLDWICESHMGKCKGCGKLGRMIHIDESVSAYQLALLLSPMVSVWDCIVRKRRYSNKPDWV